MGISSSGKIDSCIGLVGRVGCEQSTEETDICSTAPMIGIVRIALNMTRLKKGLSLAALLLAQPL